MSDLVVHPARSLQGSLIVPGDKSVSHRAFLLGALATGTVRIVRPLDSEDVWRSRRAVEALGVAIREREGAMELQGAGWQSLRAPAQSLDMGNSGTTTRLLMGILAGRPFSTQLFGDASLSQRPMRRVVEPLTAMGARITPDRLPLTVQGGPLKGIRYEMPVASAQVKSALLLAGLQADGPTTVIEPVATRDHTERMLRYLGAKISVRPSTSSGRTGLVSVRGELVEPRTESNVIAIEPGSLTAREIVVPGDFSSAAFFFVAAAIVPGSTITVRGVGLNPTRTALLEILRRMGAKIEIKTGTISGSARLKDNPALPEDGTEWEPVGDVTVSYAPLKAVTVEPAEVPNAIDELPILMVAATQGHGITRMEGVGELRVKETDRIRSMVDGLSAMGAKIREEGDSVFIEGPVKLRGAEVDSRGDHRTAMALAVAGLAAEGPTRVRGSEWINISFPQFAGLLEQLRRS